MRNWFKVELTDSKYDEKFSAKAISRDGAKDIVDDILLRTATYRKGNLIRVWRGPTLVALWKYDDRSKLFVREADDVLSPFKCYSRYKF